MPSCLPPHGDGSAPAPSIAACRFGPKPSASMAPTALGGGNPVEPSIADVLADDSGQPRLGEELPGRIDIDAPPRREEVDREESANRPALPCSAPVACELQEQGRGQPQPRSVK